LIGINVGDFSAGTGVLVYSGGLGELIGEGISAGISSSTTFLIEGAGVGYFMEFISISFTGFFVSTGVGSGVFLIIAPNLDLNLALNAAFSYSDWDFYC
jgi:hypothetical protein